MASGILKNILQEMKEYHRKHGKPPSLVRLTREDEWAFLELEATQVGDTIMKTITDGGPRALPRIYGLTIEWDSKDFGVS
jgi:hypothetical protein